MVDLGELPPRAEIVFGALVTVEVYEPGESEPIERTMRLVDQDESDPNLGRISVQSPIGRALLGRKAGDTLTVVLPKGTVELEVLAVRYGPEKA